MKIEIIYYVKGLICKFLLISFSIILIGSCTQTEQAPPNVIVILLDDMGFSDLSFLGSEIPTPNIDKLARKGITYSQFYVYPRCSPTRAALLTGRNPHAVGMGFLALPEDIDAPRGPYQGYLDPETVTLADDLQTQGYKTYMSGKWHLGEASEHWPLNFGFDRYFGLISGASSYFELLPQPGGRVRKMAMDDRPWFPPDEGFYMTDAFTNQAVSYVSEHYKDHQDNPFFLYLAYTAPHWPLHAQRGDMSNFENLYEGGWEKAIKTRIDTLKALGIGAGRFNKTHLDKLIPPNEKDRDAWRRNMQIYAAMMKSADDGIGRLIAELERQDVMDETVIVLFSDNGASAEDVSSRNLHDENVDVGRRGSYIAYGPNGASLSNMPFRDFKGTTYEGAIRSPLIVYGAGVSDGSLDTETVIDVKDIRAAVTQRLQNNDLSVPLFEWRLNSDPIYWEHLGWRGVRLDNWKGVSRPGQKSWELYDIVKDPSESRDIASSHPKIVEIIDSGWAKWSEEIGATPLPMKTLMEWYQPKTAQ